MIHLEVHEAFFIQAEKILHQRRPTARRRNDKYRLGNRLPPKAAKKDLIQGPANYN